MKETKNENTEMKSNISNTSLPYKSYVEAKENAAFQIA